MKALLQVAYEPTCCSVSDLSECPYWGDDLFLNTKILFNPLFDVHAKDLQPIGKVQTEYKSWNCKKKDSTLMIGLVIGIGGGILLLAIGALLYMKHQKKSPERTPLIQ